jgi:DNA (cytosine-5)-methyltransferase 1
VTFGSLFSGIGGLDLGLERAGMECRWQVEIDPYCQRVLAKHWPNVERFSDVKEVGSHNLKPIDLICGGFPCQDISLAGKGAGLEGERSGLWWEFHRIIMQLRPRYVIVENVGALVVRGLDVVLGSLAEGGYDASWDHIPAAAVGAPHRRDRIFIVAYAPSIGHGAGGEPGNLREADGRPIDGLRSEFACSSTAARTGHRPQHGRPVADTMRGRGPDNDVRTGRDAAGGGGQDVAYTRHAESQGRDESPGRKEAGADAGNSMGNEPPPRHCDVADSHDPGRQEQRKSIPDAPERLAPECRSWWSVEPDVGRVANGVPARVDRLRGLGNAVVPQVAEYIGQLIMEADRGPSNLR